VVCVTGATLLNAGVQTCARTGKKAVQSNTS
jgi:hypothetical protein